MNETKWLIVCWSGIWSVCLWSLAEIKIKGEAFLIFLTAFLPFSIKSFPLWWPTYAFVIWGIGCLLILFACFLFRKR